MSARRLLPILALALLAGPLPSQAASREKPSFDCRKASTWSEKAICADPALARLDRRIAERFARLKTRFRPGPALDAVMADQYAFLAIRDWLHDGVDGNPMEWLQGKMLERAEFLDRVRTRAGGDLVGTWANAWGEVEIRPAGPYRVRIVGSVVEPFTARWSCEIDEVGARHSSILSFIPKQGEDWRIRGETQGGVLFLKGFSGGGSEIASSYCGELADVEDAFFLVGPISDSQPEDW